MKKRLIAFGVILLFWVFYFIIARSVFLLVQFRELAACSPADILKTFIYGFRLDLSSSCYILIMPLLLAIGDLFSSRIRYNKLLKIYSSALIILFSALVVGDALVYSYWGFRLEYFILEYLKTPADAAASASTIQVLLFCTSLLIMAVVFILLSNRLIDKYFPDKWHEDRSNVSALLLLSVILFLIIPIRGGIGKKPVNAGSAYFSKDLFLDHAAVNIVWNFGNSAIRGRHNNNPYNFHKSGEARNDVRFLLEDPGTTEEVINTDKPNILIIILESFGSCFTDPATADSTVTPEFRRLIREGIYFSNIYAAGSRTDKALPAILSAYPNLPAIQIIRDPEKVEAMPGIIKLLDSTGYKTSFWYGGDLNFANIRSYVRVSGYRQAVTRDDFDRSAWNSKWGVHDELLLDRLLDSLQAARQPFAYTALTLSSHEPFEVPMEPAFKSDNTLDRFKNSLRYTDRSLGKFIEKAKTTEWWKNTLVVLTGDHSRRNSVTVPVFSEEIFRIPVLWTGGALVKKDTVVSKYGNQFDLPVTIARQLKLKNSYPFSKDLLSGGSNSFAFYTFHEGFAFITDSSKSIFEIKLKGNVETGGRNPEYAERLGKSFLQALYDDYLSR